MKKLFFAIVTLLTATTVFAGNTNSQNEVILSKFKNNFKQATNVELSTKKDYVDVSYMEDGEQLHAYYSLNGQFVGTAKAIAIDDLPINAKRTFAKKYDGYTVKEALKFESADEAAYFISAEKDNQSVILKVTEGGWVSVFKKVKTS